MLFVLMVPIGNEALPRFMALAASGRRSEFIDVVPRFDRVVLAPAAGPPVTCEYGSLSADSVVRVELVVAVIAVADCVPVTSPDSEPVKDAAWPVVFWFHVGTVPVSWE